MDDPREIAENNHKSANKLQIIFECQLESKICRLDMPF